MKPQRESGVYVPSKLYKKMVEAVEQAAIQYHDGSQDEICTEEKPCGFCKVLSQIKS
jgi:hypothetical protein